MSYFMHFKVIILTEKVIMILESSRSVMFQDIIFVEMKQMKQLWGKSVAILSNLSKYILRLCLEYKYVKYVQAVLIFTAHIPKPTLLQM